MKKFIFTTLTKFEYLGYALVIMLWVMGAILTIIGFPWITVSIVLMHVCEVFTIGIKAGHRGGEKLLYSIAMCMMFGFFWWIPLKTKTNQVTFD
ncbi:MAG: hypothetical protein II473_06895 [Clostridia bacterium]|jgi:hypothetical protein|nr:hypothetical protein [Clostridia bacterium]MBQ1895773.1 hypothetical protein [Clostridia bacterium]MBQ2092894.1 hypothetical protein [Clostridia bacterium]MBQ2500547.1 hypothetical protein [Clostridia bacterium]MBQ3897364.1 hypothetical protein [Clostridia bacterium]